MPAAERPERNWVPLAIAAGVVIAVAVVVFFAMGRGRGRAASTPISAQADAYAANLPVSNLAMSESSSLSGGKVTYLDGHIQNQGGRTVTGVTVQVLYRDFAHEVVNNFTQPLTLIRMREPYIDVGPVSAAPIAPGAGADFRLIFDGVKADWDGAYPDVRIVRVDTK
jgi:hypothetical protein